MKKYIEERVLKEAFSFLEKGETVRSLARVFGVSKSTVHFDLSKRLKKIDFSLFNRVDKILKTNLKERHLRGGEATKKKFEILRKCG